MSRHLRVWRATPLGLQEAGTHLLNPATETSKLLLLDRKLKERHGTIISTVIYTDKKLTLTC
jgi:hypothetical protein